jgi:hypothetical protein
MVSTNELETNVSPLTFSPFEAVLVDQRAGLRVSYLRTTRDADIDRLRPMSCDV